MAVDDVHPHSDCILSSTLRKKAARCSLLQRSILYRPSHDRRVTTAVFNRSAEQGAPAVVVHRLHVPPPRAIRRDPDDATNLRQAAPHAVVLVEDEPDAGHHHPFEPALEDRRHRAPPRWVDEDEGLGLLDQTCMPLGDRVQQWSLAVVRTVLVRAHCRTELIGIEIQYRDLVAPLGQRCSGGRCDCVAEAVRIRVGNDDNDAHVGRTIVVRPTIHHDGIAGAAARPCLGLLGRFRRVGQRPQRCRTGPVASPRPRAGTNDGGISLVFVGSSSGYMVGSFVGGRFLDRGRGHQMWSACMITSVVMIVVISQLGDLAPMVGAFVVLGLACGAGDVSGNTLVVWSRPDSPGAALNALHLFFALGALSAPLLTNRAIAWSHSLWPVAVPLAMLTAVCCSVLLSTPAPLKTRAADHSIGDTAAASVRHGQLAVVSLFFFVYVASRSGSPTGSTPMSSRSDTAMPTPPRV